MSIWYALCDATHLEFLRMTFMKNALLAVCILAPLFGLLSTMIVTGRMSFFSDALGHSGFTGIAIGVLCGSLQPTVWAAFALLFSFVRSRSRQSADTIIGVFSSTAVALGIFIATLGGNSFTKFNRYLIGDILSVTPGEIGRLALVLLGVLLLWVFAANRLFLTAVHPQLASSRGIPTEKTQTLFTVCIAVVVTLAMSWVGLMVINSLLVLPAASSRNLARNLREYHLFSVLGALACSVLGLVTAYYLGDDCAVSGALFRRHLLLPRQTAIKNAPGSDFAFRGHIKPRSVSPPGRNKMKIHVIRRLRRPEKYRPPRKCGIFVPMGQKIMHTVEA